MASASINTSSSSTKASTEFLLLTDSLPSPARECKTQNSFKLSKDLLGGFYYLNGINSIFAKKEVDSYFYIFQAHSS